MSEQVTIEAEFFKHLMDARDASERLEFTVAEATRERDREHQRAEKFLRSLMEVRKELRKRPDADELAKSVQRAERAEAAWRDLDAERMDMFERVNVANERAASLETTNNSLARERDMAFTLADKAEKARDAAHARAAKLTDELTVTRNAGETWRAGCEKAEAELESLRARIDPGELAGVAISSLFARDFTAVKISNMGGIAETRHINIGAAKLDIADDIREHLNQEGKP